ncbi:MAG: acyl carrier protein [Symploca sp. SIO1B1]|nr:acyl carrier protein [Symploca sp. SIO1B1]
MESKSIKIEASEIQLWLVNYLAELLEVDSSQIDPITPFDSHGLNSLSMAGMVSDLALWLGKEISPDSAYQYPTIEALAHHLATEN